MWIEFSGRLTFLISDFTPYEGKELTGCPSLTMVRGNIIMEEGEIVGKPGLGKFIPRRLQNTR